MLTSCEADIKEVKWSLGDSNFDGDYVKGNIGVNKIKIKDYGKFYELEYWVRESSKDSVSSQIIEKLLGCIQASNVRDEE